MFFLPFTVDQLIKENSHIFTDTQCKVCSAVLISESQKLAHYQVWLKLEVAVEIADMYIKAPRCA